MTTISSTWLLLRWNFFSNQRLSQKEMDKIKAPIQRPEMVSSIPSQRERPKPPATATVQTGHMSIILAELFRKNNR